MAFSLLAALILLAGIGCRDRAAPPPNGSTPAGAPAATPKPLDPSLRKPAAPTDWPLYLRDLSRSGTAAVDGPAPPLKIRWTYQTSAPITASPIVIGDVVYFGSTDGRFYAVGATSWGARWRFRAEAPIQQAAAYVDGVIVFADSKANAYGLAAETGEMLWRAVLPGWTVSPPVAGDGLAWFGVHPSDIVSLDPSSGAVVSRASQRATIGGVAYGTDKGELAPLAASTANPPTGSDLPYTKSMPVRAGDLTYAAFQDGSMRVHRGATPVWNGSVGIGTDGTPAIAHGTIYLPSLDGQLYALDGRGGASTPNGDDFLTIVAWESATRTSPRSNASPGPLLNDRSVWELAATSGGWAAVRLPTGAEAWVPPGDWARLRREGKKSPVLIHVGKSRVATTWELPAGGDKPIWSPNGGSIAFFLRSTTGGQFWRASEVATVSARTGVVRSIAQGTFYNPNLSWSRDSKTLALETYSSQESAVWVVGASGDDMKRLSEGDAPAWSPAANQLAFLRRGPSADELWRMDAAGSNPVRIGQLPVRGYSGQFAYLPPPVWDPKGISIAVGADARYYEDRRARLVVLGTTENALASVVQTPAEKFRLLSWSPDRQKIACVLTGHLGGSAADPLDQRVYVYWVDGKTPPFSVPHTLATWVDADTLAYVELAATRAQLSRVWLMQVSTRARTLILEAEVPITGMQWVESQRALSLWSTVEPIVAGRKQAAQTRGWLVRLTR
ncbi:hypothetical protein FJZ36_12925 [Candidatus Poribacteria bacterium]|nr:hypothetical protein [Candidatus Poribacteria bacterium]